MTYWSRWDDQSIRDHDVLYRHVPVAPNAKKRQDPTDGSWCLTKAAFTSDEMKADGWSTYRAGLMLDNSVTVKDIEESGDEPREAWEVEVRHARTGSSGVIDEVDPAGGQLGLAHGLIRHEDPTRGKEVRDLRDNLISIARRASSD